MADEYSFLESLQVEEEVELPKINRTGGGGRERAVQDNPFVAVLQESYQTDTGKATTVQARHAVKAEYLIRQAAEDLGIGVRVVRLVDGERVEKAAVKDLHPNKNVKIMFQGQTKRKYAPRTRRSAQ